MIERKEYLATLRTTAKELNESAYQLNRIADSFDDLSDDDIEVFVERVTDKAELNGIKLFL